MHPAISTVIRKSIFFEWFCFIHSRFRTATWSENPACCKEAKGINKPRTKAESSWRFPPIQNGPTCLQHTMAVGHALCYIQRAPHSRAHTCDTKFCFTIISFLLSFFCFFCSLVSCVILFAAVGSMRATSPFVTRFVDGILSNFVRPAAAIAQVDCQLRKPTRSEVCHLCIIRFLCKCHANVKMIKAAHKSQLQRYPNLTSSPHVPLNFWMKFEHAIISPSPNKHVNPTLENRDL